MKPVASVLRNIRIVLTHRHLRWQQWLFLIVFFTLQQRSLGTSVVLIQVRGGMIYLITDSLARNGETNETQLVCKIRKDGEMYWATATHYDVYRYTGFSVSKVVAATKRSLPVSDRMREFVKLVTAPLERAMADSKSIDPKGYADFAAGKRSPLQIVFVEVEHGVPTYEAVTLIPKTVRGRITLSPLYQSHTEPTPQKPVVVNGFGTYDTFFSNIVAHQNYFGVDPVHAILGGMDAQATATPYLVSGPFAVLAIDSHGPNWKVQGECKQ